MPILKQVASSKLANITIRIPATLAADVADLKASAKLAGLEFPVAEICRSALESAVRDARKELARIPSSAEASIDVGASSD